MANYYGRGRTNVFAVKDVQALRNALECQDFEVEERSPGCVAIFAADADGLGDWSRWIDGDDGEDEEFFVPEMIAAHLQPDQVAVFVHAGSEKLRYVTGYSIAVHSDGRRIRLDLDEIIRVAAEVFAVPAGSISAPRY